MIKQRIKKKLKRTKSPKEEEVIQREIEIAKQQEKKSYFYPSATPSSISTINPNTYVYPNSDNRNKYETPFDIFLKKHN